MYEKFSQRVERVIKDAHAIAQEYDLEYVGTEHILLAIARDGSGGGAKLLAMRGATYERVKEEVDRLIKHSMEETWVFGRLPGTPHFKNVVAKAIEAARAMDSKEVCTEHLLVALLKEKGSVAYNALTNLKVTFEGLKKDLEAFSEP